MEIKKVDYKTFDVFVGKGWKNWVRVEVNKNYKTGNKEGHIKNYNQNSLTHEAASKILATFMTIKFGHRQPENVEQVH